MSTWRPQEAARFKTMVGRAAIPAGSSPLAVVQVILPGFSSKTSDQRGRWLD